MTWTERPEKEWKTLNPETEYRKLVDIEEAWRQRFEDPKVTLEEGLGLLHVAFQGNLNQSPRMARYVMRLATWEPPRPQLNPYDRQKGIIMVKLRNKAFDVLMTSCLQGQFTHNRTPVIATSEPVIIQAIVELLHKRLHEVRSPDDLVKRYHRVATEVLKWCLEYRTGNEEPLASEIRNVTVIEDAIPVIVDIVLKNDLNLPLLQKRKFPNERSDRRERLIYTALLKHVTGNNPERIGCMESIGRPGSWELVRYIVRQRVELRDAIETAERIGVVELGASLEGLKAELAGFPSL